MSAGLATTATGVLLALGLVGPVSVSGEITQVVAWGDNDHGQCDMPPWLTNVVSVSAGAFHSLALKSDGTVVSWGSPSYGGTVPAGLSNVVAISAGPTHNLALRANGTAVGWGSNSDGQSTVPGGITDIAAVAAGGGHSVLLRSNGVVIAWGNNVIGQTNVPPTLTNAMTIGAGTWSNPRSLAVRSNGAVAIWGYSALTNVPPMLWNVVAIDAGDRFNLALSANGRVTAWGYYPDFGETNVPANLTNVMAISTGHYHCLALTSNGAVVAWGQNWYGQTNVPLGLTNVQAIAAGFGHSLAVIPGGAPFIGRQPSNITCFSGTNVTFKPGVHGVNPLSFQWQREEADLPGATNATLTLSAVQLADIANYRLVVSNSFGSVTSSPAALNVVEMPAFITSHPANRFWPRGSSTSFTVGANGSLPIAYQWRHGGTAIPDATNSTLLLDHVQFADAGIYSVSVSNSFGGVVSSNAELRVLQVVVWGDGSSGQSDVPIGLTNAISLSGGFDYAAALRSDGTLVAWGTNTFAQTNIPVGLDDVIALAPRSYRTGLALKSDQTVVAWGNNSHGQRDVPANLSGIVAVAAGATHSLALNGSGQVAAWGNNTYGLTNVPASASNVLAIAAGDYHNFVLRRDGSVAAWGNNASGQGSVPQTYVPPSIYVPAVSNVLAIASGANHNLALRRDGSVYAWGSNSSGQTTVPAGASNNIVAVAGGGAHSLALRNDGKVFGWGSASHGQSQIPVNLTNVIAIVAGDHFSMALIGDGRPVFTQHPVGLTVNAGGNVVLCAAAVGTPAPVYQWQFNGTNLASRTNSQLSLTNIPVTAAGSYRCIASNLLDSAISSEAILTVTRLTLPSFSPASLGLTNGGFRLRLTGLAGEGNVVLYASSNLHDWQGILTNPPRVGSLDLLDPGAASHPHRFYRAAEEP